MEMGRKQRTTIARTMEHVISPISFLFYGRYRSIVKRPRVKDSATTEPFHCVSLEIQDEVVRSLPDALIKMTQPEAIEGNMSRQLLIENAPPILIIHLKRFVYNAQYGVEKLNKFISYPEYLELDRNILHSQKAIPGYHLIAVIYHHGRTADGGHYTCHIRQSMKSKEQWIHFDDASFVIEPLEAVLAEKTSWKNAYLLFYMRYKNNRPRC